MIWDLVACWFCLTMAVAGWNLGLFNCWPTPIAMVAATISTHSIYMNVSGWLMQSMGVPGAIAVFIGYFVTWVFAEVFFEAFLLVVIRVQRRRNPTKFERVGGAVVAVAKSATVILFASLASLCTQGLAAPSQSPQIAVWLSEGSAESRILNTTSGLACKLPSVLVNAIVSQELPAITDHSRKVIQTTGSADHGTGVRALFQQLHQLQNESAEPAEPAE